MPLLPPCRSKGGNNNTYCHDSPLNFLDWEKALEDDAGLLRFTRHMIGLRCGTARLPLGACSGVGQGWPWQGGLGWWRGAPAAGRCQVTLRLASTLLRTLFPHHTTPHPSNPHPLQARHPRLNFLLHAPHSSTPPPHPTHFRHAHKELRRSTWVQDGEVEWHGTEPGKPDWTETSRFLAYTLKKPSGGGLYIAFNSSHLPEVRRRAGWCEVPVVWCVC